MNDNDWRFSDRFFERRITLMSSLIRNKIDLDAGAYDFMDYLISQGYTASAENLDKDVMRLHTEYTEHLL